MKRRPQKIHAWAVVFWLFVWQAAAMLLRALYPHGALLLASPLSSLVRLLSLAATKSFWQSVGTSAAHIFGGFLLSCALAVVLAALSTRFSCVEELLAPTVAVIKTVPVASFIILALVWLDSRSLAFFISALMAFPPVYLNVLEGVKRTDTALLEMAKVFRVPFSRVLRGVYLPQVLPYFRAAVSVALGLCWKAGTAAEVIALSGGTIGERLYTAKIYFETPDLFAWTAVIVLLSAGLEKLFLLAVDKMAERMSA